MDWTALGRAVQLATSAFRAAETALNDIHARLQQVDALLSPMESGRRRSPQQIVALQVEIDSAVETIDRLAREAMADGRALLRGDWSCSLPDGPGGPPRSIHVASMLPQRLGNSRLGFLSSLHERASNNLRTAGVAVVRTILQTALRQIAEQRRQIEVFSESVVQPCAAALTVVAENESAAATALGDADFAARSSRFTPGHALIFASAPPVCHPITAGAPSFKLVVD